MTYKESIPRELTADIQDTLLAPHRELRYIDPDGKLNMKKLLRSFREFFRENSESGLERFDYKEAGFQLLLQAFLQRVINGFIGREYVSAAAGSICWFVGDLKDKEQSEERSAEQRVMPELKAIHRKGDCLIRCFRMDLSRPRVTPNSRAQRRPVCCSATNARDAGGTLKFTNAPCGSTKGKFAYEASEANFPAIKGAIRGTETL